MKTIGILILTGCDNPDSCQSALRQYKYFVAEKKCEIEYRRNGDTSALDNWIRALGEQGKVRDITTVIDAIARGPVQAEAMMRAARYIWSSTDPSLAKQYYASSAGIFREAGIRDREADALHGLFYVTWLQADYRQALSFATRSLEAARSAQDLDAEIVALTDLFIVFEEAGNLGPAQQALSLIQERLETNQVTLSHIETWINQGLLYLHKERFGLAIDQFNQALNTKHESLHHSTLRALHLNMVHANLGLDRIETAAAHLAKAWENANPDGSMQSALLFYQSRFHFKKGEFEKALDVMRQALRQPDLTAAWEWEMHYWVGKTAESIGDVASATDSYRRSIAAIEALRNEVAFDDMKAHLTQRKRDAYEALFLIHFINNELEEAFEVSEQAKARGFIDAFVRSGEPTLQLDSGPSQITQVADRLDNLRGYITHLKSSGTIDLLNTKDLLKKLGQNEFLSYFIARNHLFVIKANEAGIQIKKADLSSEQMNKLLMKYRENRNDRELLAQLGSIFFPPGFLPAKNAHVYLSPDGYVSGIAPAALRIENRYFIERNTFSMVPSANAWALLIQQEFSIDEPSKNLVVGDPHGDLPAADAEAREVSKWLNGTLLMGNDASTGKLKTEKFVNTLHVATHSGINHLGPWIRLADGEVAGYKLTDILPKARFTALASCASGVGQGDNFWGSLGGLLISSGTSNVLVSLWSVTDGETRRWIQTFYREYETGSPPALASAIAQRESIATGGQPSDWGAFVVLGGVDFRRTHHP